MNECSTKHVMSYERCCKQNNGITPRNLISYPYPYQCLFAPLAQKGMGCEKFGFSDCHNSGTFLQISSESRKSSNLLIAHLQYPELTELSPCQQFREFSKITFLRLHLFSELKYFNYLIVNLMRCHQQFHIFDSSVLAH